MISKGVTIGLLALLISALLGGSAYILLRPDDGSVSYGGAAYGRAGNTTGRHGNGNQGIYQTRSQSAAGQGGQGQGFGGGGRSGQLRLDTDETSGEGLADHPSTSWLSLAGKVTMADGGTLTVETSEGSFDVHLAPDWHWESSGFLLEEGAEIAVTGFYEGDSFEAAQIEETATGETASLRDETDRPLWSGRGSGRQGAAVKG